jgi:hypothetical protein
MTHVPLHGVCREGFNIGSWNKGRLSRAGAATCKTFDFFFLIRKKNPLCLI